MTEFSPTDFGFSDKTRAELDAVADRGGVMGECGYGYACPDRSRPRREGYALGVIGTKGNGNRGVGVLIGLTPETRQRLRIGRANALSEAQGISYDMADTILGVGGYASEGQVIAAALAEWDSPVWKYIHTAERYKSPRQWCADHFVNTHDLSAPRLSVMMKVCARLYAAFSPKN